MCLAFIRMIAKVEIPLSLSNWVTLTSTPIYYICQSIQSLPDRKDLLVVVVKSRWGVPYAKHT